MYIPHYYKEENSETIYEFLRHNAFAILVSQAEDKPWATHLPLELEREKNGDRFLVGHLAKANPQWKYFADTTQVLAIFNGPHSYVSSSWYRDEEVPTWNYMAVHVYGQVEILSEAALRESLNKLVDRYEAGEENPVSLDRLSSRTMRQIRGIVGFRIRIKEIQAAYKLSQGRAHDHPRIIEELEKSENPGSRAIAEEMRKISRE